MNMKTYRSRVSITLIAILYIFSIVLIGITYWREADIHKVLAVATILLVLITFITMFFCFGIKYVIDGNELQVKCMGLLLAWVDIRTITGFEENHNPLSAPAASLKRLYVYYGNGDVINISPRRQEEFIAEINAIRNAK